MESSKTPFSQVDLRTIFLRVNVFSLCTTTALHDNDSLLLLLMKFAKTLFLFTKSDIKTILIPVVESLTSLLPISAHRNSVAPKTVFAVATAPLHDSSCLPQLMLWTWLHVLQCALANQSLGPDEDAVNKPDRPIPSGRITVEHARILRWGCLIPCFALSVWYSAAVLRASVALAFFVYIYNELELNSHWFSRNVMNCAGLACFEIGATLIAGQDRTALDWTSKLAIFISTSIFLTTIHTQDFKDELGDMKVGRRTLPMIFPVASRVFILFALAAWSLGLTFLWNTGPLTSATLLVLSGIVGGRFVLLRSIVADQRSFYLYNVWLSLANALPALTYRAM